MHKTRLIVGCGYVGERVAKCWHNSGDRVVAITRSWDKADRMRERGWEPVIWDWLDERSRPSVSIPASDTVLIAVSHAPVEGVPPEETHTRGLTRLANQIQGTSSNANWADRNWIYLSTTGVFAPVEDGSWVDESSPVRPTRPGSIAALAGERWIESHITAAHRVVLRPAGIYGPQRIPRWESIRDGVPLRVDPDSYLNLIHADDLAMVVTWVADALDQGQSTDALYCVCDGNSPTRGEYYRTISEWMHWPAPTFDTDAQRQSRSEGNKRVCVERLRKILPTSFAYPSFREGLRPLLQELPS